MGRRAEKKGKQIGTFSMSLLPENVTISTCSVVSDACATL